MMDNFLKINGQARLIFFYQEPEAADTNAGARLWRYIQVLLSLLT